MAKYTDAERVEAFWRKVDKTESCWLWQGGKAKGYGSFSLGANPRYRSTSAHCFAYMLLVGPVPEGLELDHLCHNADKACKGGPTCPHRACVNPAHLEPTTRSINLIRGHNLHRSTTYEQAYKASHAVGSSPLINKAKSHCPQGHEYSLANTYFNTKGHRLCRACGAASHREARKRAHL